MAFGDPAGATRGQPTGIDGCGLWVRRVNSVQGISTFKRDMWHGQCEPASVYCQTPARAPSYLMQATEQIVLQGEGGKCAAMDPG